MIPAPEPGFSPLFLDTQGQRLFALTCVPTDRTPRLGVLICPALAEEMNRTRRTVRLLADGICNAGMAMAEIDLHGTGDSEGDFADGCWGRWLEDLDLGAQLLIAAGCRGIVLLGIRGGSLLAWDLLTLGGRPYVGTILWQPVVNGRGIVTDLLRMRVAADAMSGGHESVTTLRQQLQAGETVETGGYELTPDLFRALEQRSLRPGKGPLPPVFWLELAGDTPRQTSMAVISQLASHGFSVTLFQDADPAFWGTTEITVGRLAIARTLKILAQLQT